MTHAPYPTAPRRGVLTHIQRTAWPALAITLLLGAAPAQAQPIFRANSAVAGSEFSAAYDIANAIDGSGLPMGFDLGDVHATYARDNHWTTRRGAIDAGTAWATFRFDNEVALTHFHMWNHLSNGVASNADYGVSLFNLYLRDVNGVTLSSLMNQAAIGTPGYGLAQSYQFARVAGVREVHFEILNNQDNTDSFTGLAEVAFSDFQQAAAVPEPTGIALTATGLLALVGVGHRRRKVKG